MHSRGVWRLGQFWMDNENDGSLFTYLAFYDTDPVEANAALQELMTRYGAVLGSRCERLCRKYSSLGYSGRDLANEAFWKAMQRAETYKPLDKPDATSSEHRKWTVAWLYQIAFRLLMDAGRQASRPCVYEVEGVEPEPLSANEIANALVISYADRFEIAQTPAMVRAFDELDERSQIVLAWTVSMRHRSPAGIQMERGSAQKLADRLDTTPANIRQIRKRAVDTLNKAILQSNRNGRQK